MRKINIVRDDLKYGLHYAERPKEDLILIFNKRLYRQPLNNKVGIHFEKSMFFKTLKK